MSEIQEQPMTPARVDQIVEPPHEEGVVTEVCANNFKNSEGWWLGLPDHVTPPNVGDKVQTWGGFGYPVRGLAFNGIVAWYRTQDEQDEYQRQQINNEKIKKKAEFEKNKPDYEARIAALPEVFQKRFERFQKANPNFGWEFGGYELMVCESALQIADVLKTGEAIKEWQKGYDFDKVPGLDKGHSGNSLGMATRLAYWYVTNPENVTKEHGALVCLVGCEAYGCEHPKEEPAND